MSDTDEESDHSVWGVVVRRKKLEVPDPSGGGSGSYVFCFALSEDETYGQNACYVNIGIKFRRGEDSDSVDERVGYLEGHLLRRPSRNFFEMADALDGELQELACLFCEPNGSASRVRHPDLQNHPFGRGAVGSGGFFHISKVELKEEHQGKDLSLRAIHEALVFLDEDWSLCVMIPGVLCRGKFQSENRENLPSIDAATIEHAQRKIMIHFGRMGFVQAEHGTSGYQAWFLTSQMYFVPPRKTTRRWLSKSVAEAIVNVYMPPLPPTVSGLDKELLNATSLALEVRQQRKRALRDIRDLVGRGASINRARAIHQAAANDDDDLSVLSKLVSLGGDVNFADENGDFPLHIAVSSRKAAAIKYLLEAGADINATNIDGKKALDNIFIEEQIMADVYHAHPNLFHIPPKEIGVIPKWETVLALMPQEVKSSLVDQWLSPRMRKTLLITARHECEEFEYEQSFGSSFKKYTPRPLKECCGLFGINRIEFIPKSVIENNPMGFYKSFHDGYYICFKAIEDVLENDETPTVHNIRMQIGSMILSRSCDKQKFDHFISKGGRIEYALDAVVKISETVLSGVDDRWDYHEQQDDIEALPSTPLDKMFDVVRFMCINRGGGSLESCGPCWQKPLRCAT